MNISIKSVEFSSARELFSRLREEGKKVAQCHGTFDLLHPGHMIHLEEARALADVLVVTITGEKWVNKGPGRPYFNDQLRVKALASLEYVDYVVVVPFPAAVEAIEAVCPDVYCKGREYEDTSVDVTGNIHDDIATVERLGGRVAYVGSVVFSSTRLLNRHFDTHSPDVSEFCRGMAAEYPIARLRELVDGFARLNVLVIGDIIFDRYTTVAVQGLTSKDRILSGRVLGEETQTGGALVVCRHLLEFTPNVKLVGLTGGDSWSEDLIQAVIPENADEVLRFPEFTTIVKQRFVEPQHEGSPLSKLFAVNQINGEFPSEEIQHEVYQRIESLISSADLVMVMDFGHGVMAEPIRRLVEEKAKFLALNCQTNSNNHGFNIINRQYKRCDSFSLDQAEIKLACGKRVCDFGEELAKLKSFFSSRYAWLTRGGTETIGMRNGEENCMLPPLEHRVVDTIGAGDAFTSAASLAAASGLPVKVGTFLGQLAGAQAVRVVGNSEPIRKHRLLKGCEAMLTL